ncbi:hypothetical protein KSZ28_10070 [Bacteroides salyersiae]|uniref:DUF5655 domain-containing protein n=1 Tax=Bacteroides salyersiae TaxID=291644 RepID=UPI001C387F63|nr:DUF5655 domain-containing protein [Bacteroides salyersiae]MBV4204057.1 hypothetical protein [Bacteroides salyersiae]MCB6649370.1 DUF5655 domain-containing protein [Bacteroides salyersiae]
MSTYKIYTDQLTLIKEKPFKLEKEIQSIVEKNLQTLLGLDFIKTEFSIGSFRIDSLAFDSDKKSFVIIEYKRDKNFSVIDQGYAYLSLMLNNKAEFILEYNESKSGTLKRNDVDWSQSKVLFVSPNFTTYQKEAINFKDLPIELWEIKRFTNDTLSFEQIVNRSSKESIKTVSNSETITTVSKEIKVYSEQDHLENIEDDLLNIYAEIKEFLLSVGEDITIYPKKKTIGFKIGSKVFCDIVMQNKGIRLFLNAKKGTLKDPECITRDVSEVGHWGNGAYEVRFPLKSDTEMDYVFNLLRQTINKNKE